MQTACLTKGYEAEIQQIVCDVFSSMLRMDVEKVDTHIAPAQPTIAASVQFLGSWKGAFRIECTPEQTFEFAKRLLNVDRPQEVDADVCDAFGELANMIGGNLKAVLPHPVHLSMPSVVQGADYSTHICKPIIVSQQAFLCEMGAFWVTLVEFVEP